jgi:aminoglycoside phosphotransferase (APT) family kinase protein
MLDAYKHEIVFTHGELRPDNTIVKNGRVTAIIDWVMAGWYSDHWEFVKASVSKRLPISRYHIC